MLIQTKPKEAGNPVDAVQFLGDPDVHPDIYQETCAITKRTHWRLRTSEERGSQWIGVGYWIIGRDRIDAAMVRHNAEITGDPQLHRGASSEQCERG